MKQIILIISSIILAGLLTACDSFFTITESEGETSQVIEEVTMRGTVRENIQGVAYDANNVLVLETAEGRINVLVMEGGLVSPEEAANQCNQNQAANEAAWELEFGDVVEVFGQLLEDGSLEVCSDSRYSITLIEAAEGNGEEVTIRGTVLENIQGVAYDGNNELVLETEEGQVRVLVMESGFVIPEEEANQCNQNQAANEATWELQVGDVVEVFGRLQADGSIEVCSDTRYSITLVEEGAGNPVETYLVRGVVLENNHSCEVDATCYLLVDTEEGEWRVVYGTGERLPVAGEVLCNATSDFTQAAWDVEVGATIEAIGRVRSENEIGLCYEGDYSLLVVD